MTYNPDDYQNKLNPLWCKGCSFFNVLSALTTMLSIQQVKPSEVNIISGIGCSSRLPLYMNTFGMHTLHGRAIPIAVGARLARPDIPVIVTAGDGDLFSIGVGHFVHAARKNFNITVLCMDNRMYAMTKNQSSPTSLQGHRGSLTPEGKVEPAIDVVDFAISCNASFVARTIASDPDHMVTVFNEAFTHHGFSFVHIFALCKSFDKQYSSQELSSLTIDINQKFDLEKFSDKADVHRYSMINEQTIPIGIFWKQEQPIFEK